jgi:signal transduction histidine kinase
MLDTGTETWFLFNPLIRMASRDFRAAEQPSETPIDLLTLSKADGLPDAQITSRPPSIAQTPDGKVWFAQFAGLAMLDPALLKPAPKVLIRVGNVTVDRSTRAPGQNLTLSPGTHHVEIRFDAVDISSPDRTRLQYRMEGVDPGWIDAEPVHSAVYSTLPPGTHALHIRACNRDGVWDRAGIVFEVVQQPFHYQTGAFRAAMIAAIGLMLAALSRLRSGQIAARVEARLEGRMAERERIARELHDTLLQSVQGLLLRFQTVAGKLAESDPSKKMLEDTLDRADLVVIEARERVKDLRSASEDPKALTKALGTLGAELAEGRPTQLQVSVSGPSTNLNIAVWNEIYWIAREALANAFRHAGAQHIDCTVEYGKREFRLSVKDDGRGFPAEVQQQGARSGHWGLIGMRERAQKVGGKIGISNEPGGGTTVSVRIPATHAYKRWEVKHR